MRTVWLVLGTLIGLLVITGACGVSAYNHLIALNEQVDTGWAQVETVLQRRYDLIPNLVNTVRGFAQQEQQVLTEVTRLRSQWGEARTPQEKIQAASQLEGALSRLLLVVERYPELRSSQHFLALQDELAGTENRIAVERRRYNEAVREYNTTAARFPNNLLVSFFGFAPERDYFEASPAAQEAPKVEF